VLVKNYNGNLRTGYKAIVI